MLHRLGFVLAEGWFFLLIAVLLGVWIGWLIWGRDAALSADAGEASRLRADLDACQSKGREQSARIASLETEVSSAKSVAAAAATSAAVPAAASGVMAEGQSASMVTSGPAPATSDGAGAAPMAAGFVAAVPSAPAAKAAPAKAPAKAASKPAAAKPAAEKPAAKPVAAKPAADAAGAAKTPAKPKEAAKPKEPAKPKTLTAPRGGKADDLKLIKGVGPKMEALLHKLGFFHFDQLAAWTAKDVAWVDENLEDFKGRATREDWVAQAKDLAAGKPPRKGGEN